MLCARQVAAYLEREDNHTNQKSHLPDFLRIYEFLLFHFGMKCIRQILPENIFNYLEEGLNFTFEYYLLRREISTSISTLLFLICTFKFYLVNITFQIISSRVFVLKIKLSQETEICKQNCRNGIEQFKACI